MCLYDLYIHCSMIMPISASTDTDNMAIVIPTLMAASVNTSDEIMHAPCVPARSCTPQSNEPLCGE